MEKYECQNLITEYKALSKNTRGKASNIWALEIMRTLNVVDCASLLYKLSDLKDRRTTTLQERNSNFWYHKLGFNGVLHARKIQNIERYFPNANLYLVHPIWQLLDSVSPMADKVIELTDDICTKNQIVLTVAVVASVPRQTPAIKEALNKLAWLNDFDGLFCLLVIQGQPEINDSVKVYANLLAFNLYCRLMIIRYPKKYSPAATLFKDFEMNLFTHLLTEPDIAQQTMSTVEKLSKSFKGFGQGDNALALQEFLFAVKALLAKIIARRLLPDSEIHQHAFLFYALQDDLALLYEELDKRRSILDQLKLTDILNKVPATINLMK